MGRIKVALVGGVLASSLLLSGLMTGCSGGSAASREKVATVDGTVITKGDYDKAASEIEEQFHLADNPEASKNPLVQETIKRMVLQKLIVSALLKNDAQANHVVLTKEEIKKFRDDQVKLIGGEENLKKFLEENKLTEKELNDKIEEQLLINKLLEKRGGENLKVSDKEAQDFYNAHPTEFQVPETIQSSHILVKAIDPELKKELRAANPKITDAELSQKVAQRKSELKAKADGLYAEVTAHPDQFAAIAKKSSDDFVSAQQGGDLGARSQQELDGTFWAALKKTKPGTIHPGVVQTPFGFHIIKVQDHVSPHTQTFVEAKPKIVAFLAESRKKELLQQWFSEKQAKAQIVIEKKYQAQDPAAMQQAGQPGAPGAAPAGAPQAAAPAAAPADPAQAAH
jgi:parvulin-like peptidyl-prolyl isomerase